MRKAVSSKAPDCQVKKYVGTSFDEVKIVADNIDDVITVADNITKIDDVMPHVGNIATVANNIDDVNTVADNIADVNAVVPHLTEIDTVATNIDAVKNTSDNMDAVIDAPNQAAAAKASADAALVSETNAKTSETNAKLSETNASTSEQNAAASAQAAQASASAASASEQAASTSETNAKQSELNAATSAANALASEQAAKLSETNASISETNAANSATAAANSATAAATSETNAAISEGNAKTSETNAAASEQVAITKAAEASTSATNAAASEASALQSKTDAEAAKLAAQDAQQKSETIYEAFMKGAVYRGGWNPEQTQAYPDPLGTNSQWDVWLPPTTPYYDFDGKRWYSGDRLIWSQPDMEFFHITRVAGVLSVNGKTGAVNLTAEDFDAIDAIPNIVPDVDALFAANKHVIDYTNASVPGLAGQRALLHIQNGVGGFQLAARSVGSEYHVRSANSSDGTIYPWERLYTTGYKPTPADIGAATDDASPTWYQVGLDNGTNIWRAAGKTSNSVADDWNTLDRAGIYARLLSNTSTNGPVGGTGYHYLENYTYGSTGNTTQIAIPYGVGSNNGRMAFRSRYQDVWNPWEYIYTTENKPTPSELGVLPIGGGELTGPLTIGSPTTDQILILKGSSKVGQETAYQSYFNSDGSVRWGYDGFTAHDSGTWRRVINRVNGKFSFATNESDNFQCFEINGKKVYNEGFKPTAADINAVAKSGDTMTGGLRIDEGSSNASQLFLGSTGKRWHVEAKTTGDFDIVETDVSSRFKIRKGGEATLYGSLNTADTLSSNRTVEVQGTSAGNLVPTAERAKLDGYGVIGNRRAVYFTNGSDDPNAYVQIGVGGPHNGGSAKLDLTLTRLNSSVPIAIQGQNVVTEGFNRTQVIRTTLGTDNSWYSIAEVTLPQNGSTAVIEMFGGAGYNVGSHYQSSRHQIIVRSSNGNPKGLNGQAITDHPSGLPFDDFGWVNTSGDNYTIYVRTRSPYSTNILVRYMCSHTITPNITSTGATEPSGIVKGRMVTSYTSYNKDLGAINSVDGKGLELNYSTKKTWIGSRNTSYCHMETEAPLGFYSYSLFNFSKGLDVLLNQNLYLGGKAAFRNTDGNWLRINDLGAFGSGIYCGSSLLRTDGHVTSGSWSTSTKSARLAANFTDSGWATNGTAGLSVNNPDSVSAHWLMASYYDGTNIRSGIQVLSNADGRMRFYTNRRANYVEVNSGNVVAQGNVTGYSDARVKTDLEVIPNALDKVSQLTGYTYKRTDRDESEGRKVGLIAQEVEKVLPEAVVTVEREDLGIDDFKTLDYGNMVALLVESIKELKAEVDSLKKELGR